MLAQQGALTRQMFHAAIQIDITIGHFTPPFGCDQPHGADAAVNIDPAIAPRRTCKRVQRIEFILAVIQILRQAFQQAGTIMEPHGPQGRPANIAGMVQHRLKIQPAITRTGDRFARGRIVDIDSIPPCGNPFCRCVTQHLQH